MNSDEAIILSDSLEMPVFSMWY